MSYIKNDNFKSELGELNKIDSKTLSNKLKGAYKETKEIESFQSFLEVSNDFLLVLIVIYFIDLFETYNTFDEINKKLEENIERFKKNMKLMQELRTNGNIFTTNDNFKFLKDFFKNFLNFEKTAKRNIERTKKLFFADIFKENYQKYLKFYLYSFLIEKDNNNIYEDDKRQFLRGKILALNEIMFNRYFEYFSKKINHNLNFIRINKNIYSQFHFPEISKENAGKPCLLLFEFKTTIYISFEKLSYKSLRESLNKSRISSISSKNEISQITYIYCSLCKNRLNISHNYFVLENCQHKFCKNCCQKLWDIYPNQFIEAILEKDYITCSLKNCKGKFKAEELEKYLGQSMSSEILSPLKKIKNIRCSHCFEKQKYEVEESSKLFYISCSKCKGVNCFKHNDKIENCLCFCPKCLEDFENQETLKMLKVCKKCKIKYCFKCSRNITNNKCSCLCKKCYQILENNETLICFSCEKNNYSQFKNIEGGKIKVDMNYEPSGIKKYNDYFGKSSIQGIIYNNYNEEKKEERNKSLINSFAYKSNFQNNESKTYFNEKKKSINVNEEEKTECQSCFSTFEKENSLIKCKKCKNKICRICFFNLIKIQIKNGVNKSNFICKNC